MKTITLLDTVFERVITISAGVVSWVLSMYETHENEVQMEKENVIDTHEVSTTANEDAEASPAFKPVAEILSREREVNTGVEKNTVMYALMQRVPVFKNPTIEYDGQIGEVPYGDMLIVLEPKGRFYHIVWNTLDGWVLKDDIADRALRVHPVFVVGEENSVDHPNTAHVRSILGDVFGLGRSEFPLQAGEYVLYRLWKKGVRILWPHVRPRVPGLWHKILRGVENVHIGVLPEVGRIMEYTEESDVGHLAFVEAIFPDGTITITEANYPDRGIYSERELSALEWKSLKPLFIGVR